MRLNVDDRFNRQLPADPIETPSRRQVNGAAFSFVTPRLPSDPQVLHVAPDVASMIGLTPDAMQSESFRRVFSGAELLPGTRPYAMCYGGHQFGQWAGQLGDGRAINLAEVLHDGQHLTLQLKGAGETPYSRTADGLAVLRSSVREHLCSEAMHHLGVPTTRSLCLLTTGDSVVRDVMYDGNSRPEPGAVVCRVARSFIRFGNFQILAAQGDVKTLQKLADYTIQHYFPEITTPSPMRYSELFSYVCQRTTEMILHWQRVGFVHGVMNTDNMSIHGETIDYGPYGWLEGFQPDWTPNTTDRAHRRYRFGDQPQIALWNLVQLANALFPLVRESEPLQSSVEQFYDHFAAKLTLMQASKIGLDEVIAGDEELVSQLDDVLQLTETDMTIFFRLLANVPKSADLEQNPDGCLQWIRDAFYAPDEVKDGILNQWQSWFRSYLDRIGQSSLSDEERRERMNRVNPKYVLRNYMAQLAIEAAESGDASLIDELYTLLLRPYDEQPQHERWFAKRPDWARNKVGCSMLSCSS